MHLARVPYFHLTHLPERHLEETPADAMELNGVAGADEAVVAPAIFIVAVEPVLAQRVVDRLGDRLAGADQAHAPAKPTLEHWPDQRVVGATEDHGVDLRLGQRLTNAVDTIDQLLIPPVAFALDQRGE